MKKHKLDAIDLRILSALQSSGPMSKTKLAEVVGLSPTPGWARLTKLKKAGLILGYRTEIALDAIADVTQVIVTVSLTSHRKSDFDRFESVILSTPEIIECTATGGGMDYVLKVVAPNLKGFQQVMDDLLSAELGIEKYMTYIGTRTIKNEQPDLKKILSS